MILLIPTDFSLHYQSLPSVEPEAASSSLQEIKLAKTASSKVVSGSTLQTDASHSS
jgi:hypothetical protein